MLPIFMLHGVALESALKAVIINQDASLVQATKLANKLREHDLCKLAKMAGIALSQRDEDILKWVTEVVIWKARYQVPIALQYFSSTELDRCSSADIKLVKHTLEQMLDRARLRLGPRFTKRRGRHSVAIKF
ncbi:hypothetical protein ABIF97_000011 [Bradyrhizobium japonicum]